MSANPEPIATDNGLTLQLASWAASTRSQGPPPPNVTHQVRRSLIDYLGATIVGASAEPASIVRDYAASHDSSSNATVIATDVRLSAPNAALVNGTAAHALELDDGYTPGGGHPGCTVVSAALAMAEATDADADQLTRSIALGYEVACRLGGATHPSQWKRGFHNTPLFGTFGAATATGALLDLDATGLGNAFGLAGSARRRSALVPRPGLRCEAIPRREGCCDGVVSAELAARGLMAPTNVLEGAHGYMNAFRRRRIRPRPSRCRSRLHLADDAHIQQTTRLLPTRTRCGGRRLGDPETREP